MARKRLSDTAGLMAMPCAPSGHEYTNVSVRQIDNGWVKETSICKDGSYSRKEEFSRDKPDACVTPAKVSNSDRGMLRSAAAEIKR